ncbi:MBL fold metallo-hydrolase [soil metagenome]
MKIKFLGAAGTVTGSSYVLTSGSGQSILIDLGMFQGLPEIDELNYKPFEYDCSLLSGAVLAHAHLDHCGRLPILIPRGFKGNIWMTPSTRDLTELSLLDSARIATNEKTKVLYDTDLAEKTLTHFKTVGYRTPFQIGDFRIFMRDAGHIVGSASLEIEDAQANSEIRKIVFSGDLGNSPEDLTQATEMISDADAVVMESTYGDRLHPDGDPIEMLQSEINAIEHLGGTLLIPAFALERTQELLHMIMHLKEDQKIKEETPIFLDSPMAEKATEVYMNYPEIFNTHIQNDLKRGSLFNFPGLEVIFRRPQSEALHRRQGPKVIIAGSGMMTGGRIVGHAARYLPLASSRLLIVGYQGEGTLGRDLMEGKKQVTIEGINIQVMAKVNVTHAMSSHADQQQLFEWLKHIKNVKKVFLTHGEDESRTVLAKKISDELRIRNIALPTLNQEISF